MQARAYHAEYDERAKRNMGLRLAGGYASAHKAENRFLDSWVRNRCFSTAIFVEAAAQGFLHIFLSSSTLGQIEALIHEAPESQHDTGSNRRPRTSTARASEECAICTEILNVNICQLKCKHPICLDCVRQLNTDRVCPFCTTRWEVVAPPVNNFSESNIACDRFAIRCVFNACDWVGSMFDFEKHIDLAQCAALARCGACGYFVHREQLVVHAQLHEFPLMRGVRSCPGFLSENGLNSEHYALELWSLDKSLRSADSFSTLGKRTKRSNAHKDRPARRLLALEDDGQQSSGPFYVSSGESSSGGESDHSEDEIIKLHSDSAIDGRSPSHYDYENNSDQNGFLFADGRENASGRYAHHDHSNRTDRWSADDGAPILAIPAFRGQMRTVCRDTLSTVHVHDGDYHDATNGGYRSIYVGEPNTGDIGTVTATTGYSPHFCSLLPWFSTGNSPGDEL